MNVNVTCSSSSVLPLKRLLFSFWSKFKGRWSRKQRRKALSSSSNRYTKITFIYREANSKKDLKTSRKDFSCPKEGTTARWLGGWWCCVAGTHTPWSVTHKRDTYSLSVTHKREVYHNYRSFLRREEPEVHVDFPSLQVLHEEDASQQFSLWNPAGLIFRRAGGPWETATLLLKSVHKVSHAPLGGAEEIVWRDPGSEPLADLGEPSGEAGGN